MVGILAEASVRALAMAAVAAVALAAFRVHDARVRFVTWAGVLLLMLASPLTVLWGPRARVPVRAPEPIIRVIGLDATPLTPVARGSGSSLASSSVHAGRIDWQTVVVLIYVAVALAMCVRIVSGVRRIRSVLRTARPGPGYLTHPGCIVPLVLGWRRPKIVLPPASSSWPAERLAMVLAHEQAHIRRRDSVVVLLSLVNRALFWFHPLAWWLHRELAALAEQACDASAAAETFGRAAYADCLIDVARDVQGGGLRLETMAMGMASAGLRRRVRALLDGASVPVSPRWTWGAPVVTTPLLVACLAATPVRGASAFRHGAAADDPLRGYAGTFVVIDERGSTNVRYDGDRADARVSPCSTFKIPFAALFLESGIVGSPESMLKFDPRRSVSPLGPQPEAAHDQTLTSAFHESANWYFDTLSRSLDRSAVERFVERAGYGNARVRDETGSYWYDGRLRISASEQVRFLQRLHDGALGLSSRTTGLLKDVAEVEATPRWRLAAKTGACQGTGEATATLWYVGWVERADDTYYFALEYEAHGFEPAMRERIPIARDLLSRLHILD